MTCPSQMLYGNLSLFDKRPCHGSVEGVIVCGQALDYDLIFVRGNFVLFDKIHVSTIEVSQWRFQVFRHVSLFEKLIGKSRCLQNNTFI